MYLNLLKICIGLVVLFVYQALSTDLLLAQDITEKTQSLRNEADKLRQDQAYQQAITLYRRVIQLQKDELADGYIKNVALFQDYKTLANLYLETGQKDSLHISCQKALSLLDELPSDKLFLKKTP